VTAKSVGHTSALEFTRLSVGRIQEGERPEVRVELAGFGHQPRHLIGTLSIVDKRLRPLSRNEQIAGLLRGGMLDVEARGIGRSWKNATPTARFLMASRTRRRRAFHAGSPATGADGDVREAEAGATSSSSIRSTAQTVSGEASAISRRAASANAHHHSVNPR
jgi:hypothetical protein